MLKFNQYLDEALTTKQSKQADRWQAKAPADVHTFSDHVMGNESRIHIPLHSDSVKAPLEIHQHLEPHGFKIKDYAKGTATDKYERETTIGKALAKTKAPPELVKKFTNDPVRNAGTKSDLHVVISRHHHDVAGMSTGRGWTSCMNMDDGLHKEYLKNEIAHGTHVAYLAHKSDTTAENPIGRVSLKPHVSEDGSHTILRPEGVTYGSTPHHFHDTVRKWTEDHFPAKPKTVYTKHHKVYDDDMETHTFSNDHETHAHLAAHEDKEVRGSIAKHTKDPVLLGKLAKDMHQNVYRSALQNPHITSEHIDAAFDHSNSEAKKQPLNSIMRHGYIAAVTKNSKHLDHYTAYENPTIRTSVAVNQHATVAQHKKLLGDSQEAVQRQVAQYSPHSEVHDAVIKNDTMRVKNSFDQLQSLARNPHVKGAALDHLVHHDHVMVRRGPFATKNPNLTKAHFEHGLNHEDGTTQRLAKEAMEARNK